MIPCRTQKQDGGRYPGPKRKLNLRRQPVFVKRRELLQPNHAAHRPNHCRRQSRASSILHDGRSSNPNHRQRRNAQNLNVQRFGSHPLPPSNPTVEGAPASLDEAVLAAARSRACEAIAQGRTSLAAPGRPNPRHCHGRFASCRGDGTPSRMMLEKSGASPAFRARSLMRERARSSSSDIRVSTAP